MNDNFSTVQVRELIRRATLRTGNVVFDDDLMQEASLRALDAFRRAGRVEHPRALLTKIVDDTVSDHWRRRRPLETIDAVDERWLAVHPRLEEDIDRDRQTASLRMALLHLHPFKRRLLQLFYEEDLTI